MSNVIIYPPYIESKLPTQVGETLRIPYLPNRAVGSLNKMYLQVKTIITNQIIFTIPSNSIENDIAVFNLPSDNKLVSKQNYKAQIAYESNGQAGTYSKVGIFKYMKSAPDLYIVDSIGQRLPELVQSSSPASPGDIFKGEYVCLDYNETVNEYRFQLVDTDEIIIDTGFLPHDFSLNEDLGTSYDIFEINQLLVPNKNYKIIYTIITNNLLQQSKECFFKIAEVALINSQIELGVDAKKMNEEGFIQLYLYKKASGNVTLNGSYRLIKNTRNNNKNSWEVLTHFTFNNYQLKNNKENLFIDYFIEQGFEYQYALQKKDDTYWSKKIFLSQVDTGNKTLSQDYILVNYEDMFLYDGEKQLKIRFDPKVSSFKNFILESKTNTLGNKYPLFFRNGYVNYKEFSIAGLISVLMDDNNDFNFHKNDFISETNLTNSNICNERMFKMEILEWLSNGETKLFKSPVEGLYLVKLMNINLTPNDTLGRMLHSFSAQASECAELNLQNLINLNLIKQDYTFPDTIAAIDQKNLIKKDSSSDKNLLLGASYFTGPNENILESIRQQHRDIQKIVSLQISRIVNYPKTYNSADMTYSINGNSFELTSNQIEVNNFEELIENNTPTKISIGQYLEAKLVYHYYQGGLI